MGNKKNKNVQQEVKSSSVVGVSKRKKRPKKSLREEMVERLKAARFRHINEKLYTVKSDEAKTVFEEDGKAFEVYHEGFRQQVELWPINPLDVIIASIKKRPDYQNKVIADFGCGEAKLALELAKNRVFSFDVVALNDRVTACDMAHTKLFSSSIHIAVFCLSLMGTNITDFIKEATRVLKKGGELMIAEVESRFENVDEFVKDVLYFGYELKSKDFSHNLFHFLYFTKTTDLTKSKKKKLPQLSLLPCAYKKR